MDDEPGLAVSDGRLEVDIRSMVIPTRSAHNPHLPCELQGGHRWGSPTPGEDVLGHKLTLVTCNQCGRVRA